MVLVDTSVWIAHLRDGNVGLEVLLNDGHVTCHPFIVGEIACGHLKNRYEILSLMNALPMATDANNDEVMEFIENNQLMGKGFGYIDMHLLASAVLSKISLWTFDKKLHEVSVKMRSDFRH